MVPQPLQQGWAPLGAMFFVASVAVAGVPPLAGFMGKALLLQAAGRSDWATLVVALVLASSLAMMVALARAGSTLFWKSGAVAAGIPRAARGPGTRRPHRLATQCAGGVAGAGAGLQHLGRPAGPLHERRRAAVG
jgi:multicomponent K+:H+ antiporter subunit D